MICLFLSDPVHVQAIKVDDDEFSNFILMFCLYLTLKSKLFITQMFLVENVF